MDARPDGPINGQYCSQCSQTCCTKMLAFWDPLNVLLRKQSSSCWERDRRPRRYRTEDVSSARAPPATDLPAAPVQSDQCHRWPLLVTVPRELINVSGKCVLHWLLQSLQTQPQDRIYIVHHAEIGRYEAFNTALEACRLRADVRLVPLFVDTRGAVETALSLLQRMEEAVSAQFREVAGTSVPLTHLVSSRCCRISRAQFLRWTAIPFTRRTSCRSLEDTAATAFSTQISPTTTKRQHIRASHRPATLWQRFDAHQQLSPSDCPGTSNSSKAPRVHTASLRALRRRSESLHMLTLVS